MCFEYLLAVQIWALSQIPSNPDNSLPNHFSQIWIICMGGFLQIYKIIILHGFYDIFRKHETTKS